MRRSRIRFPVGRIWETNFFELFLVLVFIVPWSYCRCSGVHSTVPVWLSGTFLLLNIDPPFPGLLRRIPEMPRSRRGGSPGAPEEPAAEPRDSAVGAGLGHREVVGRAGGRRGTHRGHGRLREVLRGAHAVFESEAGSCQVIHIPFTTSWTMFLFIY